MKIPVASLQCFLAVLLGAAPTLALAQTNAIVVEVVDRSTGRPLENVVMQLPEARIQAITDAHGRIRLEAVESGTYTVILTRQGYQRQEGEFGVLRSGSVRLSLLPLDESLDTDPGAVVGRVLARDSGEPLYAATVTLVGAGTRGAALRTETGSDGLFEFREVPPGRHALRAERLGMATQEHSISVPPGGAVEVTLRLSVQPIPLEGLTVTAHSKWLVAAGFFRRRKPGYDGRQWDRSQLEQLHPEILRDVLETVPWVNNAGSRGYVMGGRCDMAVFVDDIMMPDWFDPDLINPERVEALEVYTGRGWMPMEYADHCGVILVWLRH